MKLHGQDLPSVFAKLPWQYKIVTAVGAAFVLFVIVYVPVVLIKKTGDGAAPLPSPLQVEALQGRATGILDPSLASPGGGAPVWMAYTSQDNVFGPMTMGVRLALSNAGSCKRWSQISGGFPAKEDDIMAADEKTVFRDGAWRVETPTLVHDPSDPGREWKLYAYKYFWAKNPASVLQVAQHFGFIVYKYTSDPRKEWSEEQWLFSPAPDYPPPPYEQMILLHLNRLDPSLEKVVTYSRPSAIYRDDALSMTLSAFTGDNTPDRVIMISSPDHGDSWRYVGTPLRQEDLPGIGPYTRLGGATLIEKDGVVYLAAVLGDDKQRGKGTFIFAFDDFSRGLLKRDAKTGAPVLLRHVPLQSAAAGALGGGFAAYTDDCDVGLLTSEQKNGTANFQIFRTYIQPIEK